MSDEAVILLVALRGKAIEPPEYVIDFDPDGGPVHVDYPTGLIASSPDPGLARRYPSKDAAIMAWRAQSTRTPLRPDGQPNRPLTAYTVEIFTPEQEEAT